MKKSSINIIFNYNKTMSYYLLDFSKKNIEFNFDNLIIGKKIKLDQDNYKYYIYYQPNNDNSPCELYIKLPKLRLIYNIANYKYDKLSIPIYPNCDITNAFIEWFNKFENDIQECFNKLKNQKEFVSLINKKNTLNFIKSYINEKPKISSNISDDPITLNEFKINGQIELVLKLSYIWGNKNKYGLSSNIYQIKYYGSPNQLEINFIDTEPVYKKHIITNSYSIIKQYDDSINFPKNLKPESKSQLLQQPTVKMIPSLMDLQKALKKLKPREDN